MHRTLRSLVLFALVSSLAAGQAEAAAWYLGEIGSRALGRGGAVIVNPEDPSAIWVNPAAITLATGLQLRLEGTFVFHQSTFTRDCGSNDDCGPLVGLERSYRDGTRTYSVTEERSASDDNTVFDPTAGNLGRFGTPSRPDHAVSNQALVQPIPEMFMTLNLDSFGLDGFAVGAGVFAPQAGDYAFGGEEYTRYTLVDRDMLELYYALSAGYRFRRLLAVGASLQGVSAGVRQRITLSADLGGNENPDYDLPADIDVVQHFIPSGNFGLWSAPLSWIDSPFTQGFEIGASMQLGRTVEARGPIALDFANAGPRVQEFLNAPDGDPTKLTIVGAEDAVAVASFNLAPIYRVGAKYGVDSLMDGLMGFEVEADFVYEDWSAYDHIQLGTEGLLMGFGPNDPEPLAAIVQPKDWMGAWSVRVGGELTFLDEMLAVRSGVFYETDAIPNETYSVELMNGQQVGAGVGGSVKLYGVTVDVGYSHMFVFDRTIGDESIVHAENSAPPLFNREPRTRIAMGQYQTSYDVVSVGLKVAFDEMLGFGVHAPAETKPVADTAAPDDISAPTDEAPPEEAPVEEAPVEEAPVEEAPVEPAPEPGSEETPAADEPAAEEPPATPVDERL
jgi:long-subunit fatty acid transport protein